MWSAATGLPKPRSATLLSAATSSSPPLFPSGRPPVSFTWTQRERMVGNRRWGLVESSIRSVRSGGSSRVFRKAFSACSFMRSASAITPILVSPLGAARCRVCSRSRISATEIRRLFERGRMMRTQPLSCSSSGSTFSTTGSPKRSMPPPSPDPLTREMILEARSSLPQPSAPVIRNAWASLSRPWADLMSSKAFSADWDTGKGWGSPAALASRERIRSVDSGRGACVS